jgi:hypothetical protein
LNSINSRTVGLLLLVVGIIGIAYMFYNPFQGVTAERAERISERYLESQNNLDLEISEIMEFEFNYYVIYDQISTHMGAFEMLIDKSTGRIFPEYGPNMMWNLKYGHSGMMSGIGGVMGGFSGMMGNPGSMMGGYLPPNFEGDPISEEEALKIAQEFLDRVYPGSELEDPHPFYGYYTIHTTKEGEIFGMLSVNAYDGAVWYHNWHGEYIRTIGSH